MAIVMMCEKDAPGAVRSLEWSKCDVCHEDHGVEPESKCCRECKQADRAKKTVHENMINGKPYVNYVCDCLDRYGKPSITPEGSIYLQTTHVGVVLELREMNGYDDSDFYAVVWDTEKGETKRVVYASTRGWTYPNGAAVDATPEVLAAYTAWTDKRRAEAMRLALEAEAKEPKVGRRVKVVKGRKVPIGSSGEVFWYGPDKFEDRRYTPSFMPRKMRCGVKLENGDKVFTAADNVEVIR